MSWVETAKVAVKEIRKKRETTEAVHEAEELIRDCEKSEIGEIRSGHMDDSTRLYRDRGWVQIFSGYLNKSFIGSKSNDLTNIVDSPKVAPSP